MKRAIALVKAALLGGVVVVLPAWLAVLLVLKALGHLEIFVKPVSSHLPQTLGHPRIIAIVVLVALCFLVGVVIQTASRTTGRSSNCSTASCRKSRGSRATRR